MYSDYAYALGTILVLIGAAICGLASLKVKLTYAKYSKIRSASGMTANEAAMKILHDSGIYDVRIERIKGHLTDHYSPNEKVLRLSDATYGNSSVAAIGVAAHECGHAIQHATGYGPLSIRSMSVPLANFGSKLSWPMIFIGLLIGFTPLAEAGVVFFMLVVFFQFITLPVEFNASSRALQILESSNMLYADELRGSKKVLTAAALTYVAALVSSILQLLRLVLIVNNSKRRD